MFSAGLLLLFLLLFLFLALFVGMLVSFVGGSRSVFAKVCGRPGTNVINAV